jgi:hypothetical protein
MTAAVRAVSRRYLTDVLRSPGQVLLLALSLWFISNGLVAYAMNPSFAMGSDMTSCTVMVLGFIPVTVNGWHALFRFLTGIPGLFAARRPRAAYWHAIGCGWFYLAVAGLGFAGDTNVLHLMAVDTFGNYVHAVEGGLCLTAAALVKRAA